jgi:hypothetical protein
MKKPTKLLIQITFITVFVSSLGCSDDDEKSTVSIVGKWQVESRELFDCPDAATNNVLTCSSSPTASDCGTWEFKSDGNYTVAEVGGGGYTYQYEAKQSGQLNLCYSGTCYPYLYAISGNKLTITEGDFTTSCLHKWILIKI